MPLVEASNPGEERPMNDHPDVLRAAVERRFAQVARSPGQERKFPVGPAGGKRLGDDRREIDALPLSVTESFARVGNPLHGDRWRGCREPAGVPHNGKAQLQHRGVCS
jgi:hypothetical protein